MAGRGYQPRSGVTAKPAGRLVRLHTTGYAHPMAEAPRIDVGEIVRGLGGRVSFLLSADKQIAEVLEILRDTHRIMGKLERAVDRAEDTARQFEERLDDVDVSAKRIDRLEEAVLNIERATLAVEAALHALPKTVQQRIRKELRSRNV